MLHIKYGETFKSCYISERFSLWFYAVILMALLLDNILNYLLYKKSIWRLSGHRLVCTLGNVSMNGFCSLVDCAELG